MNNRAYFWVRFVLAVLLLLYAGCTIARFSNLIGQAKSPFNIGEAIFWTLGPPTWFFIEYYAIDLDWIALPTDQDKKDYLASVKTYADYSSKIWAAVLAAVLYLLGK
jgi:hypothetical protein